MNITTGYLGQPVGFAQTPIKKIKIKNRKTLKEVLDGDDLLKLD